MSRLVEFLFFDFKLRYDIVWFNFQISFKRRLFEQSIGYIFCILTHNVREFVRDPKEFAKFLFCFGIMSPNVVVPYVLNLLGKLGTPFILHYFFLCNNIKDKI